MKSTILFGTSYGQSEVLKFVETELPQLKPGMARIRVKAAGINPVDVRRMQGEFKHAPMPQTFGAEFAGVIEEIGPNQSGWQVGDEVFGSGGDFTHATITDVPIMNLVRKPKELPWAIAGSITVGQTALTAFEDMGPVKSLLIHGGSGGVGSFLIQLAKLKGIEVVATASEKNQDYIRQLGALPVVYGEGLIERIKAIHPEPFDASLDNIGNEDATQASLALVKPDGFMGTIAGRKLSSNKIKEIWVRKHPSKMQFLSENLVNGNLSWRIGREYAFSDAPKAYQELLTGHTNGGKSVLVFD